MAAIPVAMMQSRARHCRDAMRALRQLRSQQKSCEPSAVKELMGVQARHRMAYASLNAQVAEAAQMTMTAELKKKAGTLKNRRDQAKRKAGLVERAHVRADRLSSQDNNRRAKKARLQAAEPQELASAEVEEAPALF